MSFITSGTGKVNQYGHFLAREECTRKTREIPQSLAVDENDGKVVKSGTPYPSNDGNCIGFVYEDTDVTTGNMPGSVVLKGNVYEALLPVALNGAAKTALEALGFVFETIPTTTRP